MTNRLLTVAIPTYNRATHLNFLLSVLESELQGLDERVAVHVSDNASTDETPAVVEKYRLRIPSLTIRRNSENIGPDGNISGCFSLADTPYVWIVGDDDAPIAGCVSSLVKLLEQTSPDIVYLTSRGGHSIADEHARHRVAGLRSAALSRELFAQVVNVRLTFTSGVVLRKSAATAASVRAALEHTRGTSLIQLAWTYEILKQGSRFVVVTNDVLMATSGNRGGYSALDVFMINHTRLVSRLLADKPTVARAILHRTSLCHLPGLVWNIRRGTMGEFDLPDRKSVRVPAELSKLGSFRLLVVPIWTLKKRWANLFFQVSRVLTRLAHIYDQHVMSR